MMKVRKRLILLIVAYFLLPGLNQAGAQLPKSGVILCKPEVWSPDSKAKAYEYASFEDHTGYWDVQFADGRKEQIFIGRIIGSVVYPKESECLDLSSASDQEKFSAAVAQLRQSAIKYPLAKNYLDPMINKLQSELDQYAKGNRKIKGVWFTKAQLEPVAGDNRGVADTQKPPGGAETPDTHTITARDGTVYQNVTVTRVEPDGLIISHSNGITKIDFANLPLSLREKYHYDTATADAYKKRKQMTGHEDQ